MYLYIYIYIYIYEYIYITTCIATIVAVIKYKHSFYNGYAIFSSNYSPIANRLWHTPYLAFSK